MNIVEVLRKETLAWDTKLAIKQGTSCVCYAELWARVDEAAERLRSGGITCLDRVALVCGEDIECVVNHLAILSVGAVVVPVPRTSSSSEIEEITESMDAGALISEEGELLRLCSTLKMPLSYATMNPAFIRFTSGTTGVHKGVVISHEACLARTEAVNEELRITSEDEVVWVLSMAFHFVVTILLFLRKGATLRLCHDPYPNAMTDAVTSDDVTVIYAAPFHYHMLLNSQSLAGKSLKHLRRAISTTAHLSEVLAESFYDRYKVELCSAYGIIEVGLPFIRSGGSEKRGSVGRVLPGYECQVRRPDAQGVGALYLKGPGMFEAYYKPWKTRLEMDPGGWFETGDLGFLDREGYLYLAGRSNQTISFLGMKFYPKEVEEAIFQYPGVEAVAVFGVDHEDFGQLPWAKIVLKDGAVKIDEDELRRFCYKRLAKYKVPKQFEFVTDLARTPSGKVRIGY